MRKILVLFTLSILLMMTSCNSIKKETPVYKGIDAEVLSCELLDDGHYEVTLLLETGENFVYHSKYDITEIDEKKEINMGYDTKEKVYKLAIIRPNE